MLTPQDFVLLREALAYWAKHAVGLELAETALPIMPTSHVHVTEQEVVDLHRSLMLDEVRYIVVDGESNHAINTRLFRKVPRIQPATDRWQVRTVIG